MGERGNKKVGPKSDLVIISVLIPFHKIPYEPVVLNFGTL